MGERRRFAHLCGGGSPLLVSKDSDGVRAYCFRCAASGWLPPPHETLAQKLERMQAGRAADQSMVAAALPGPLVLADRVAEWPTPARVWLAKAGLGASEIARLGAGYHPPSNRVVLPVLEAGEPVFWQARSIDGRLPKYLGPERGRALAVPRYGNGPIIAVTEDILSAFKIGLAGCAAWCALGVVASTKFLTLLLRSGKPAAVWLDPDPAGQAGAARLLRQLSAYGVPTVNIVSEKDPKLHQKEYIRERLSEAHQLATRGRCSSDAGG